MPNAPDLLILVPAAGSSRRMRGRDKLLETVEGQPMLARTVRLATATGAPVLVTLPPDGPFATARRAVLVGSGAHSLVVTDASEGMATSLRAGAIHAEGAAGLMVLLPDMPDIDAADLAGLIRAFARDPTRVVRGAGPAGEPGHPVILPERMLPAVTRLAGDCGAQRLLAGEQIRLCPLPDRHALIDLDAPEDWADWRAARI